MKYCSECASELVVEIPEGDHLPRSVCKQCGAIHYRNPRVIVGAICEYEGRLLLCRRDIEPRHGFWTFPAGFLEMGETTAEGAARETLEESGADVEIEDLCAIINVPYIAQVYLSYRARMRGPRHHPTPESSETCLVAPEDIPWDELAFPTIWHSLRFWMADREAGTRGIHTLDITRRPRELRERERSHDSGD
ncbi:NUDIX hydrolase [Algiphilus sp.]|uniref:NUDIX hydrolase n=1 Tax=Algiphilus sp. TaxID=1872431 RepID=UPI0025C35F3A|nr:NUDIX hydrolase [Algiphilus sp.]MCK5769430.1 NUDIX hydrolase [Algiphilus sp.]